MLVTAVIRINFLHSSKDEAMFWICEETSVDNPGIFSLLLNGAYRVRAFSVPHLGGGWGCTRNWEGTWPGQLPPVSKGTFQTIWCHDQYIEPGEEGGKGDFGSKSICLQKSLLRTMEH